MALCRCAANDVAITQGNVEGFDNFDNIRCR